MALPVPQISIPITLPEAEVEITYNVASTETITLAAGTYINDATGNISTAPYDLGAYVASTISAASAFTWTSGERTGLPTGRFQMQTTISGDYVTGITFDDAAWSTALGYTSATPTPSVTGTTIKTSVINGAYQRKGMWIPHGRHAGTVIRDIPAYEDTTTVTESPNGPGTIDDWGGRQVRLVDLAGLYGANVLSHFAADSDFHSELDELEDTDPHFAWEAFRRLWLSQGGYARWFPDRASSSYVTVYARAPWIGSTRVAITEAARAPVLYDFSIDLLQDT